MSISKRHQQVGLSFYDPRKIRSRGRRSSRMSVEVFALDQNLGFRCKNVLGVPLNKNRLDSLLGTIPGVY